jgi:hypothetical protein
MVNAGRGAMDDRAQNMTPKSGQRFSDDVMLNRFESITNVIFARFGQDHRDLSLASRRGWA